MDAFTNGIMVNNLALLTENVKKKEKKKKTISCQCENIFLKIYNVK